jgi:hypothetical protein
VSNTTSTSFDRKPRSPAARAEDGEFVPQHDDFQFFEIVRPNAQEGERQKPSEHVSVVTRRRLRFGLFAFSKTGDRDRAISTADSNGKVRTGESRVDCGTGQRREQLHYVPILS